MPQASLPAQLVASPARRRRSGHRPPATSPSRSAWTMGTHQTEVFDAVVVGGGISGLSALNQLAKQGISHVLLLEAKHRVGGRSYAEDVPFATGKQPCDLGGQWLAPSQTYAHALANELGLAVDLQYDTGASLMALTNSKSIVRYHGTIPKVPPYILIEIFFFLRSINSLAKSIPVDNPARAPGAFELDQMTFASYLDKHVWFSAHRHLWEATIRVLLGCEASNISLLYFLWYVRQAGSMEQLVDSRGGAQDAKIVGGAYQMSTKLAEKFKSKIRLGCPVARVDQTGDLVVVRTVDGQEFKAKRVIMAVPPAFAEQISFAPPLPAKKIILLRHMPSGHIIKFIVTYKTAFWREQDLNGSFVDTRGPISVALDSCGPAGSAPALVGFIAGAAAVSLSDWSQESRKRVCLEQLARFFGPAALEAIAYVDHNWIAEPFNAGGPAPHIPPGILFQCASELRAPTGNIHWAGTETATQWIGYLDGAIQAGHRAAEEVYASLLTPAISSSHPGPPKRKDSLAAWRQDMLGSEPRSNFASFYALLVMVALAFTSALAFFYAIPLSRWA
eukprot:m.463672 g.463672  ORF g.463672 m.463672 type:complete len:561 (+) comp57038_c0_seq7:1489-3171(+)